jgi:hypothetical protein
VDDVSQRNDPARATAARAWSAFVDANQPRLEAAGLPALATRSVAHWDDLVAHGSFHWHTDPARFTIAVLSEMQYEVFVGLVESYFAAGYGYYAPESLKPEDQVRLASRFSK